MIDTIKFNKKNVKVVAHRGLSGIETENTAAAFIAAGNRTYFGIETDIHRTKDGKFVCLHDDTTTRVAGRRCYVGDAEYKKISTIKFKDISKGMGQRADLVAPLLEDYVSICSKYGKHSVLELKDNFTPNEIKKIIRIVKKGGHLDNTTFISFIPQNLFILKEIMPNAHCQFLTDKLTPEMIALLVRFKVDVDIAWHALDENLVKTLKSHNIAINCWTVDDPAAAEKLVDMGVDYITTNILE